MPSHPTHRTAPMNTHVSAAVSACLVVLLALVGCSSDDVDHAASNDGLRIELGDLLLSDIMVLSTAEGAPGTVLGAVANDGDSVAGVALRLPGTKASTVEVAPGETVLLGPEDHEIPLASVPARPGATVDLVVESARYGAKTVAVPVLDGSFPRYSELVPTPTSEALRAPTGKDGGAAVATSVLASEPVLIEAPGDGAVVAGPTVQVTGTGTAFEGNLVWRVSSLSVGATVASGYTTAGANGVMGPFGFTVRLAPGAYLVELWEPGMSEDGAASGGSPAPRASDRTTFVVADTCAAADAVVSPRAGGPRILAA